MQVGLEQDGIAQVGIPEVSFAQIGTAQADDGCSFVYSSYQLRF